MSSAFEWLRDVGNRPTVPGLDTARTVAAPVGLAALAGVVVYALAHGVFPYHSLNHDEGVYLQQAGMLLEGRLFLSPPVEESFRPWFFVESGDRLYPKYTPVPAAVFALGLLAGDARLALAAVAAVNVGLTCGVVREVFDRRTGLLAGGLLLASPLFLVDSAVFLPYAPTFALELLFAFAYLRADRTGSRRFAAVAGAAIGTAFFSRPYTAVLFAAPFVVHAAWTLRAGNRDWSGIDVDALVRNGITAGLGLAGVAVALGYNAAVTGSPFLFPYRAFAPLDGLGFGRRAILAHDVVYTPGLALRSNARVVAAFLSRWVVAGSLGTGLAAVGLITIRRSTPEWSVLDCDTGGTSTPTTAVARRSILAGLFVTVVAGNLYFWGNFNILGSLADPTDGLIHVLGPYYHFDLLLPSAAFGAHGTVVLARRGWATLDARFDPAWAGRIALAGLIVGATVLGSAAVLAAAGPIQDNRAVSGQLAAAYAPFERGGPDGSSWSDALPGGPARASDRGSAPENGETLVFLPTPYGNWLNHPFQALRNDPGFDGETVYALRENQFAVVDAYPDRTVYRYTYRGRWSPVVGPPVDARLQRVRVLRGERLTARATLGVPHDAERVSIRLSTADGRAYYAVNGTPASLDLRVVATDEQVRVTGPNVTPTGDGAVTAGPRDTVVVRIHVGYGTSGFDYRLELPVRRTAGAIRAMTPYLEVCRDARLCGGEAAYIPGQTREGVFVRSRLEALQSER